MCSGKALLCALHIQYVPNILPNFKYYKYILHIISQILVAIIFNTMW